MEKISSNLGELSPYLSPYSPLPTLPCCSARCSLVQWLTCYRKQSQGAGEGTALKQGFITCTMPALPFNSQVTGERKMTNMQWLRKGKRAPSPEHEADNGITGPFVGSGLIHTNRIQSPEEALHTSIVLSLCPGFRRGICTLPSGSPTSS